jgi:O-antigen ligase
MTDIFKKLPLSYPSNLPLNTQLVSWLILLLPALALTTKHGTALIEICLLTLAVYSSKKLWTQRQKIFKKPYLIVVAFIFNFCVILISCLLSGSKLASLDKPILQVLAITALGLVVLHKPRERWLWYGLFVGTVGAFIFALYQRFGLGMPRASGFRQIIMFGDISMAMSLMALAGLVRFSETRLAPLLYIAFFSGLSASVLSVTKGGWVALIFSVIPLYKYSDRKMRQRILLTFSTGLVLLLISTLVPKIGVGYRVIELANDFQKYQDGASNTSFGSRLELWKAAISMFWTNPFWGVGHTRYQLELLASIQAGITDPFAGRFDHAHNELLHALATKGLVGGFALFLVYFAPLRFFIAVVKRKAASQPYALAGVLLVLAYIDFGITQVLFAHHLGTSFYALSVCVLVGLCISADADTSPKLKQS